jgi:hypothetical protein
VEFYKFLKQFLVDRRNAGVTSFYTILRELCNKVSRLAHKDIEEHIASKVKTNDANQMGASFGPLMKGTLNSLSCHMVRPNSKEVYTEMPLGIGGPTQWQFEYMPLRGKDDVSTTRKVEAEAIATLPGLAIHQITTPRIRECLGRYIDCESLDVFRECFYLLANASPTPTVFKKKKGVSKGEQIVEYENSLHAIYQPFMLDLCLNPYRATSWFALGYTFRSLLYTEIDTNCVQQHGSKLPLDDSGKLGSMLAYLGDYRWVC